MKRAFTLAEVLITLGIIGVVAAMTLPTLINKYQEKVTVTKVKKFYSMMSQTFLLSVKDNGYANEWNVSSVQNSISANQLATYLKPYLKIIKDCGTSSGCLNYATSPTTLNNLNTNNYDVNTVYYKLILADGSYIWWRGVSSNYCKTTDTGVENTCAVIFFDINGGGQPNVVGKDIFAAFLTPYALKSASSSNCVLNNSTGWGCLGYILENGNMNYLH